MYYITFYGRKSGAIGEFYYITEAIKASSESEAKEKILASGEYELHHWFTSIYMPQTIERV